jgi:predicted nuclease of predicted toxin-antitoxin system
MPITLVLDQGVPRDAAGRLCDLGYECVHVGEVGMSTAADDEILRFALGRNGALVTLAADCHAILAVSGAVGPSVIRIRIQGLRATEIAEYIHFVSVQFESELTAGPLMTVKACKATCRRLPIGRSH